MKTVNIMTVLSKIRYKNWVLILDNDGRPFLRWLFWAQDLTKPFNESAEKLEQYSRKWYLSEHMTEGELVQTALAAALMAEEHECREAFWYDGDRITQPHQDMEAMKIASRTLVVRT